AQAHRAGKRVFLVGKTVSGREAANWQRAREAGVDALLTDYPLECREVWRAGEPRGRRDVCPDCQPHRTPGEGPGNPPPPPPPGALMPDPNDRETGEMERSGAEPHA